MTESNRIELKHKPSKVLIQGLSPEEFFAGRSMPRNRELMRIYRDLRLVEQ